MKNTVRSRLTAVTAIATIGAAAVLWSSAATSAASSTNLGRGHAKHSASGVSICFVSDVHAGAAGSQAAFASYLKRLS